MKLQTGLKAAPYNVLFTKQNVRCLYPCIDSSLQELFGGYDGVQLLIQYLRQNGGQFSSGQGHHRLLLAATDCVWCTVVGNTMVEDIFLENEGAFVLLDLLKVRHYIFVSYYIQTHLVRES